MHGKWLAGIRPGVLALRRDWSSGELRLLLLALVVAIAAVSSVGFLADRVGAALGRDSGQMLGGDIALEADAPIPQSFMEQAGKAGLAYVRTLQFPSMVSGRQGSQLASLKAVAPGYPLRGALRLQGAVAGKEVVVHDVPDLGSVWVDPQILGALGLGLGDSLEVGDSVLKISGIVSYEPDRGMRFINVAPRVLMRIEDVPKTGLIAPGSRVKYGFLVAGESAAVKGYGAWLDGHLERGQKLNTVGSARPEIQKALDRAHQFLVLVALLTVMVAAIAIALAARRFSLRHRDGIAVMRCMGASQSQLSRMLWVEFALLALLASFVGIAIGFAAHLGLVSVVASWLDTSLPASSWTPALQGMATGLVLLLGFALPPLAALRRVAPARVLRRETAMWQPRNGVSYGLGLAAFCILALWFSGDLRMSAIVTAGFVLAFGAFALCAYAGIWALGLLRHRLNGRPALRFALAGMARRKGLVVTQVCALSMGLMVLLLLALTRTDLLQGWQNTVPADAPDTFLINIQPDQRAAVATRLQQGGVASIVLSPMVRGRLVSINRRPVTGSDYAEDRAKRLVDREFNLSYQDQLPSDNRIQSGRWLDSNKNEVSIESGLADALGIKLGDELGFDVAGQTVDVRVSSVREVKWDSFQANFFALLSPRALKDAPTTYITAFRIPAAAPDLVQKLVHEFPNLTVFDVRAILRQVQHVLVQVIQAVQLLFLFTVFAGILVLGAALFSTRDERIQEVALLRSLGASARQLRQAQRVELVLVGVVAGLLAAAGAVAVAWVLADKVFDFELSFPWWPWLGGIVLGVTSASAGGAIALRGVLTTPPLALLREVP
ncbi:ABC transporter permease [Paralcaligenes ginsengisoli]